jgi:hypothetical protein
MRCDEGEVKMGDECSEFRLFKEVPEHMHPHLLRAIQDLGWKSLKDG